LQAARDGSVAGSSAAAGLEEGLWLCPIEDRRRLDSPREGMLEGFSLGNYLLLVDYTGRLFREGKPVISAELGAILERLGSSAENWQARLRKLAGGRLLGGVLRGYAIPVAGSGPSVGCASPGQPGRVRGTLRLGGTVKPIHGSKCLGVLSRADRGVGTSQECLWMGRRILWVFRSRPHPPAFHLTSIASDGRFNERRDASGILLAPAPLSFRSSACPTCPQDCPFGSLRIIWVRNAG